MAITLMNSEQLWLPTQTCRESNQQDQPVYQQTVLTGLSELQQRWGWGGVGRTQKGERGLLELGGGYPGEGNEREDLAVDEIKVHFIGV